MEFEVASLDEVKNNGRKLVVVNNEKIVLFFLEGNVYAINAVCQHKGGPLEEGDISDEEVICPWHAFMYNIKTGECLNNPGYSVKTYKVKVDDGKVKLDFD